MFLERLEYLVRLGRLGHPVRLERPGLLGGLRVAGLHHGDTLSP